MTSLFIKGDINFEICIQISKFIKSNFSFSEILVKGFVKKFKISFYCSWFLVVIVLFEVMIWCGCLEPIGPWCDCKL